MQGHYCIERLFGRGGTQTCLESASGYEKAKEVALEYAEIIGRGQFLFGIAGSWDSGAGTWSIRQLVRMSRETGIAARLLQMTAHYTYKEDAAAA